LGFLGFFHLYERKTAWLAGVTILNNCDALDRTMGREKGTQLVFSEIEIQVAHKNVFQDLALLVRTRGVSGKVMVMVFLSLLNFGGRPRTR
jgi:hypothetical protein